MVYLGKILSLIKKYTVHSHMLLCEIEILGVEILASLVR